MAELTKLNGNLVMLGYGLVGQTVLPLLRKHIQAATDEIRILAADDSARASAEAHGARLSQCRLEPANYREILEQHLTAGDLLVNLSVNVSSLDLVKWCSASDVIYVDTSIEPWPGVFDNPTLSPRERSNYLSRKAMLALARQIGPDAPTAVVDHGANPGLVSHFVKRALSHLNEYRGVTGPMPRSAREWATLSHDLGVTLLQISERDTQAADRPKRTNEFVCTWSIDSFVDELLQPAELSIGTAEAAWPDDAEWHEEGCGSVYLGRPGATIGARSWVPSSGSFQGLLITHDETLSIADFLSLRENGAFAYRPTVMFVYHACDDAMLSAFELEGRGWVLQPALRSMASEIVSGMDELGVLLAGHAHNAYWYGSQLTIEETRRHVPGANATSLQVAAGALAAAVWAIRHPRRGLLEPDDLDYEQCLAVAEPYLGRLVGEFTDWTPLQGRGRFYDEALEHDHPWGLGNILTREWRQRTPQP